MYKYDKPYYRSAGSLDAQPGAERYEFSSPISGVLGSFISSDSYINPTVQSVSGPAAQVASVMFAQSPNHKAFVGSDYDQAALTKFGITYLVIMVQQSLMVHQERLDLVMELMVAMSYRHMQHILWEIQD